MSVTKVSSPMIESGTKGADIASAATVVIGTDGSYFDITGTTGISTQFTVDAGRRFTLQFDGAVTITDNAAITLSGAANFTTAAGDILSFVAVAANTVVQTGYSLVDGGSPVAPAGGNRVFIKQIVASTDASIDFIDGTASVVLDNTYKIYEIDIVNMDQSAQASIYGRLYQVSGDRPITGSAYTGGEEYSYTDDNTTFGWRTVTNQTEMRFGWIRAYGGSGTVAQYNSNGWIKIYNPSATGKFCHIECSLIGHHTDGTFHRIRSYWYPTDTTPNTNMDGIQIFMSSGTILSGYFNLYGIKDS